MSTNDYLDKGQHLRLPADVDALLSHAASVTIPTTRASLLGLVPSSPDGLPVPTAYDCRERGPLIEAGVVKGSRWVAVSYADDYMRHRDLEAAVSDEAAAPPSSRFSRMSPQVFAGRREEMLTWLREQPLLVLPLRLGPLSGANAGGAVLIVPQNAAFFALMLADIQGMVPVDEVPSSFAFRAALYVAPPFRHLWFEDQQTVIHHPQAGAYEVFILSLYPGPNVVNALHHLLVHTGLDERRLTLLASTVKMVSPYYGNEFTVMHEGASGSGKSEMLQAPLRTPEGQIVLGINLKTSERLLYNLNAESSLLPVTDTMAATEPPGAAKPGPATVTDAQQGWFLRLDHTVMEQVDAGLQALGVAPAHPLVFVNVDHDPSLPPDSWNLEPGEEGKPRPTPRVVVRRSAVQAAVRGAVEVQVRDFGLRTPACLADAPSYGILGYFHVIPPGLAWLWRLAAPRGYANTSVHDTGGLTSEGLRAAWPASPEMLVRHANLMLAHIRDTPGVRYTLTPNHHCGAWRVRFMPQWIAREYLVRKGLAVFEPDRLIAARCALLGYTPRSLVVEEIDVPEHLLRVETQREVGLAAYDEGAQQLRQFFSRELEPYLELQGLEPLGRRLIECCLDNAAIEEYERILPPASSAEEAEPAQEPA